jgi:thiol-disulfide isomerase/thioredoxin
MKVHKIVIVVMLLILAAGSFLLLNDRSPMEENAEQNLLTEGTRDIADDTVNVSGTYKDYSESEIEATKGTKLLFFHAPWCPQCRELEKSIQAGRIPSDVTIFKVDYDSNQKLRQKYGVTIQTTIIRLDAEGNVAKKYVAYDDPTLTNVITNAL